MTVFEIPICLESLLALPQRPDARVMTGDLVDFGRPVEYARLRSLIDALPMPVHLLPGNHDDRAALRAAFPEHAWMANGVAVDGGATADSAAAACALPGYAGSKASWSSATANP